MCLGCAQGCRRRRRGSGMVVRAEMFGQLTTGLESAWNKLRGVGEFVSYNTLTIFFFSRLYC
jgi:signal recognition particle subunit SRP54